MSDDSPKVSIVIPVYNGSNYLREAIESALAQTYGNIEVIVVNDGSDDAGKTDSIAKSFGERIRYLYKENGGVASALNLGIREMKGDYFAWLSHDDIYLRQRIEYQIREMQKWPSLQVSFCNTKVFYESDSYLFNKMFDESMISSNCIHGTSSYFKIWIYACSLLIHRSCFEKIGLINENLKTAQDIEITIRLLAVFDALQVKLPLTLRRDHCESGYNTMRHAVSSEYDKLIECIIAEKGLEYFFPNIRNNLSMAKAYNELGDYLIFDSDQLPQIYYERSKKYCSSPFNPALYKSVIGTKATRLLFRCKISVMHRLKKLTRRMMIPPTAGLK